MSSCHLGRERIVLALDGEDDTGHVMRHAGTDDLPRLQDIEVAAGEAFRMIGMEAVADDAPPSLDALATYQLDGRAWVATDSADQPIAYILVQIADRDAHIDQITVHPKHARRGIGRELIDEAASWATARDLEGMTLRTFRDVPWNAPYYLRLGFVSVPEHRWSENMGQIVQAERAHGLDVWPGVAMRKTLLKGAVSVP
jgi:GNAT superfamily N-acetyltransferase